MAMYLTGPSSMVWSPSIDEALADPDDIRPSTVEIELDAPLHPEPSGGLGRLDQGRRNGAGRMRQNLTAGLVDGIGGEWHLEGIERAEVLLQLVLQLLDMGAIGVDIELDGAVDIFGDDLGTEPADARGPRSGRPVPDPFVDPRT